jgi:hypothetical protein
MKRWLGAAVLAATAVFADPLGAAAAGLPTPAAPIASVNCTALGAGLLTFTFTDPASASTDLTMTAHIGDLVLGLQPASATAHPGQTVTGPQTLLFASGALVRDGDVVSFSYGYAPLPATTPIGGGLTVNCAQLGTVAGPAPAPGGGGGLDPSAGALQPYNPGGGPAGNYPATARAGPVYGSPGAPALGPVNDGYVPSPDAARPTANPTAPPPTSTPAPNPGQAATRPALASAGVSAFGQHGAGLLLLVLVLLGLSGAAFYLYQRFSD